MKKVVLVLVTGLAIFWIAFLINFPLTKEKIIGTYVNTNFSNKTCCVEAPHKLDTLILYSDNSFSSNFYGRGSYEVNGSDIKWEYTYDMGQASYSTHLTNRLFEEPRIILNSDLNHYYRKTK